MTPHEHRELDAEVAERVMGLKVLRATGREWADNEQCAMPAGEPYTCIHQRSDTYVWTDTTRLPAYSTDPGAAWEVVEAMRAKGCTIEVEWRGTHWTALIAELGFAMAPTMPEAVCRAALAALQPTPPLAPPPERL